MKTFLFISGLLLVWGSSSCKKKETPLSEQEVMEVIKKFDEGWRHKNLREVDSVLAPAYIYFTQSGGVFGREGVVNTAGSKEYVLDTMYRAAVVVQLYGNTAIVSSRWYGKGIYRGVAFDEDQRCSITVVKSGSKVQILSEHCTPVKPVDIFH
ncbi:MAG: nuclear transport factor 2 family protein [Ferruginibacter sp.]